MQAGEMAAFLDDLYWTKRKKFILFKDECHIAAKNLDSICRNWKRQTVRIFATMSKVWKCKRGMFLLRYRVITQTARSLLEAFNKQYFFPFRRFRLCHRANLGLCGLCSLTLFC